MQCSNLIFSRHAIERMFQRSITLDAVRHIIENGDCIAIYPDDKPYPSQLLLRFEKGEPIHVAVAMDEESGDCFVITAYRPDAAIWNEDFRTRRGP